ncbi:hypothetical protein STCU_04857 [Strigomonas culicis]|uniref:Ribosome quality control complex subunit 2 n=1 Tax=Strigomonas culicis TaxID=28005 RepID=S9VYS3_9TRYP|nr:hypothetical protein STCU_04857 [Strigomonas culicis]|eukprot:EPY28835.1 hypothetical protein STCU_04857 [Strigomonas culicis]
MGKQRFTALDVRASVEEMRRELTGLRLLNLYDLSGGNMFLFKFGHGDQKRTLLLENGIRLHLSEYVREKPKVPSQFTLKVRKHVRAWRLDTVTQLQHDRTIDLCFGIASTEGCFHIIIELFGKGNIILTDHNYVILMLLRTHRQQQPQTAPEEPPKKKKQWKEEEEGLHLCVRATYPVTKSFEAHAAEQPKLTDATIADGNVVHVATAAAAAAAAATAHGGAGAAMDEERQRRRDELWREWQQTWARNEDNETTKTTLSGVHHFGPALADHILEVTGVKSTRKKDVSTASQDLFAMLLPGMLEAWDIAYLDLPPGGYLIRKKTAASVGGGEAAAEAAGSHEVPAAIRYEDCVPVLLAQYKKPTLEATHYPSFGKACDLFFLHTETERIDHHNDKTSSKALSKREKFERDHLRRVSALELEQEKNRQMGEAIICNADKIDEVIHLINGALAAGIQWEALKALVRRRHAEGHPVAYMIHDLSLHTNTVSVLLEQAELYEDEDENDVPSLVVAIDLSKTAHANASDYFTKKKTNQVKLEKTLAATGKAAAGAARKADRLAAKQVTKKKIRAERAKLWWEKFSWFRTSTGDLVLQGKDAQTTEILLRKVLQLGDAIVGCEVEGALPCVLRPLQRLWRGESVDGARAPEPISRQSLEEAGAWCVARSAAWENETGGRLLVGARLAALRRHRQRVLPLRGREAPPAAAAADAQLGLLFCVQRDVRGGAAEVVREVDASGFEPADGAAALRELPTIEDLRKRQQQQMGRQQQQQQQQHHRNARANKPEQQQAREARRQKRDADSEDSDTEAATIASTAAAGPARALTKHQKRKLKRIQDKYGDQDEEDRRRGALLNGNQLAQVQQTALARGKADGRPTQPAEDEEEEEEDEEDEEEVVTDFSGDEAQAAAPGEAAAEGADDHPRAAPARSPEPGEHPPSRHDNHAKRQGQNIVVQYDTELREKFIHYTCRPLVSDGDGEVADVVLHALPVCAPTSTLIHNNYRFRSEVVFGNMKKGQVAQTILESFQRQSDAPASGDGGARKDDHKNKEKNKDKDAAAASGSATAAAVASLQKETATRAGGGPAGSHSRLWAVMQELAETSETVEQLRGSTKTQNTQKR